MDLKKDNKYQFIGLIHTCKSACFLKRIILKRCFLGRKKSTRKNTFIREKEEEE